ncbi:MAG: Lrp/AsnC family transcriptional regulator [Lachnospiraceae bacterium]|jgi:DNA-binding Lrp family transcriptional regulator|nr:Lrp/AsnC family transcriptional regulator [Lachnospiraceae bacterium]MBQ6362939.1 Lrp/AsnC family transcriptional regulator [Lachnospiraceae bacterium]
MTALEERILNVIERNSRVGIQELAILLGTEEIEVANALKKMEEDGVICGYHTMIDWDKTGIEKVTAIIEVRVTPQRGQGFESVAERIYRYPEVDTVYLVSGGYDLMIILEGKTLKEVAGFVSSKLSTLDTVISTATHFILKKYKDHGTIMEKKVEDRREKVTA